MDSAYSRYLELQEQGTEVQKEREVKHLVTEIDLLLGRVESKLEILRSHDPVQEDNERLNQAYSLLQDSATLRTRLNQFKNAK
mgnify:CR=1 FL=1|tara:strand:- start:55 stop:303 length:249 start_codon:yes stop_codon:yes gene_type:complete